MFAPKTHSIFPIGLGDVPMFLDLQNISKMIEKNCIAIVGLNDVKIQLLGRYLWPLFKSEEH